MIHSGSCGSYSTAEQFGNCEGVYSDRPAKAPSHKHFSGAPRARGDFLGAVGFDVMSCANNHMIDGGYAGLADTLELLRGQGIQTTGAGADIAEATRPAILERGGMRIAFLGFCSVYPVGYEAREQRPGEFSPKCAARQFVPPAVTGAVTDAASVAEPR